jgi:hypothetical protein
MHPIAISRRPRHISSELVADTPITGLSSVRGRMTADTLRAAAGVAANAGDSKPTTCPPEQLAGNPGPLAGRGRFLCLR